MLVAGKHIVSTIGLREFTSSCPTGLHASWDANTHHLTELSPIPLPTPHHNGQRTHLQSMAPRCSISARQTASLNQRGTRSLP